MSMLDGFQVLMSLRNTEKNKKSQNRKASKKPAGKVFASTHRQLRAATAFWNQRSHDLDLRYFD